MGGVGFIEITACKGWVEVVIEGWGGITKHHIQYDHKLISGGLGDFTFPTGPVQVSNSTNFGMTSERSF